jgi:hypothetical protein
MYSVGQQVVCINDSFSDAVRALYKALPVKDTAYTIRDVLPGIALDNKTHEVACLLVELVNPLDTAKVPQERAFNIERFAPLDPNFEVEVEELAEPVGHP